MFVCAAHAECEGNDAPHDAHTTAPATVCSKKMAAAGPTAASQATSGSPGSGGVFAAW